MSALLRNPGYTLYTHNSYTSGTRKDTKGKDYSHYSKHKLIIHAFYTQPYMYIPYNDCGQQVPL